MEAGPVSGSIADLRLSADAFVRAETAEARRSLDLTLAVDVLHSETIGLFLYVRGDDPDGIDSIAEQDRTVEAIRRVEATEGGRLYHVEWTLDENDPFRVLLSDEGLLRAVSRNGTWEVLVRFARRRRSNGSTSGRPREETDLRVTHLYRNPGQPGRQLTPLQRADRNRGRTGYFEVPRDVSMAELGVTSNAVSERLRRAERTVFTELVTSETTNGR